jgi:hypothetical protein
MATLNRGPATIYTFPARGRFAVAEQSDDAQAAARVSRVSGASSWYHEEAVREADRNRKN